jgi:hypothetical protein
MHHAPSVGLATIEFRECGVQLASSVAASTRIFFVKSAFSHLQTPRSTNCCRLKLVEVNTRPVAARRTPLTSTTKKIFSGVQQTTPKVDESRGKIQTKVSLQCSGKDGLFAYRQAIDDGVGR